MLTDNAVEEMNYNYEIRIQMKVKQRVAKAQANTSFYNGSMPNLALASTLQAHS